MMTEALSTKGPLDGIVPEYAKLGHRVWTDIHPKFTPKEFEEPEKMEVAFLYKIHAARLLAGVPFRILDTVRDNPKSAHGELPCAAVDLQVLNSYERSRVVRSCYAVGFIRVGCYPGTDGKYKGQTKRDGGGIHVDGSRTKPQDRLWTRGMKKTAF